MSYMPGIERDDPDFVTTLKKVNNDSDSSGVYGLTVPDGLQKFLFEDSQIKNPMIVFLPHFQGFYDLEVKPQFCPGGIAIQIKDHTHTIITRNDFATVIKCLAEPVNV